VDAARQLSTQIPGARIVVVEGGRHLLPQSHASEIGGLIIAASRVDAREAMP
jgi:hypothetical protein